MSWDLLNGKQDGWKKDRACVFICTHHLIRACQVLIGDKVSKRKEHKEVLYLSLEAIARLQEAFNLDEFSYICRAMIRTFCLPQRIPERLAADLSLLKSRKTEIEINLKTEPYPEEVQEFELDEDQILLRTKSPFYQYFVKLHTQEINRGSNMYFNHVKSFCW